MQSLRVTLEAIAVIIATLLIILGFIFERYIEVSDLTILITYGVAFFIGGFSKAKEGIEATIENKALNVEILMILAAIGAFIVGEYFEGSVLIFIFALSGVLESYATAQSEKNLTALLSLAPETANKKVGDDIIEVPIDEINIGDIVVVRVGESIPVDGEVIKGHSSVDQATLTGESIPKSVFKGDSVFAGTINLEAQLTIKTTVDPKASVMQKMVDLVANAQEQKSPKQSTIDNIEKWYVYIVIILALLFMFIPPLFPENHVLYLNATDAFYRGTIVLVVGSPCALVASVSPAMLAALSNAAKKHILIKGGHHLETLDAIDLIIFDKTGTITTGQPKVQNVILAKAVDMYPLSSIIVNMEKQSTHPLAHAIIEHFFISSYLDLQTNEVPGRGVEATYDGHLYQIGRFDSKPDKDLQLASERLQKQGQTIVWIHKDHKQIAFISIKDTIRDEAIEMIDYINQCGKETLMLTGDQKETAHNIAHTVGIKRYIANCFPEDKLNIIKKNQKHKDVLMVGDGLNDAPALTAANLGIAMGTGTDVSLETADIIIMNDDLSSLPHLFKLAKKMKRIIYQNMTFAILVIVSLLISNVFGLIALPLGVIGHEGSTILVILNSLRLLKH